MTLFDFFLSILVMLLGLYAVAATAVILIFFPEAPDEVPRFVKWWLKYNRTRLREWSRAKYKALRISLSIWWENQSWRVIHMFWLTLGSIALWLSVWAIHILYYWNPNDR